MWIQVMICKIKTATKSESLLPYWCECLFITFSNVFLLGNLVTDTQWGEDVSVQDRFRLTVPRNVEKIFCFHKRTFYVFTICIGYAIIINNFPLCTKQWCMHGGVWYERLPYASSYWTAVQLKTDDWWCDSPLKWLFPRPVGSYHSIEPFEDISLYSTLISGLMFTSVVSNFAEQKSSSSIDISHLSHNN